MSWYGSCGSGFATLCLGTVCEIENPISMGDVLLTLLDVDSEGADLVQVERGIAPAAPRAQVGQCRSVLFR